MEEYFAGEAAALRRRRAAGRRERRRRVRARGSPRSCPDALTFGFADDAELGPAALDGIDLKLRGRFNVENALGALAAARLLGDRRRRDRARARVGRGVPGRFESVDEGQPFAVIVDYAHKPGALETLLRAARELGDRAA